MLKSLDLFSGIGGITHGLRGLADPVLYCEKDPDCSKVLAKLMQQGRLPKAPVHGDVETLMPRHIPGGRVDIILAGFPCPGFSSSGLRQGLEHPGSSLFRHVKRLAKTIRPPLMFLENVEGILGNDDIHAIVASFDELGYDMWWVVMPAYTVGAPQKRARWFCLAVRRGVDRSKIVVTPSTATFSRHGWSSEPAKRMIPKRTVDQRRRMRMLGNSVVPECVRAAFLSLFTGCQTPVPHLLKSPGRLALTPPRCDGPVRKSDSHACACVVSPSKEWMRIPRPPGLLGVPELGLVVDPKAYVPSQPQNNKMATSGFVTKPRALKLWSTPRAGNGAYPCHVLTERGVRGCLGTQLRFEKGTPADQRHGATNPQWVEWLMGFPKDWTK